jgi:tetratricopeptide (TPR) repeat protein
MRREVSICFGLAAITLAVFWPVTGHDFINLDDPDYVTWNPIVQAGITGPGLRWAFGGSHASNWHPLTWLSHMLDCQIFGLKPGAHHLVSLGFHIASTLLLFLALRRMTGAVSRSALVAALFAWHPLHIESVAWVAERKDVLSAFFFMLTLWAYARYAEVTSLKSKVKSQEARGGGQESSSIINHPASRTTHHAPRYYLLSLFFFVLGLMSKPMLVTLPFLLLLLDYWPLRRLHLSPLTAHPSTTHQPSTLSRLALEKAPFFALALAAGVVTLLAQHAGGAVESLEQLPVTSRLANALAAYSAYLGKMIWPMNLSVFYPHLPVPAWQVVSSALLLACVTLLCLRQARARPCLLVGWLWFCVMLLPVIGLVQVGWQARADRYTYLPLIGVFIMLAWGAADFHPRSRAWRLGLTLGAALLLGACLAATRFQLKHWQDSVTLFSRALEVTTGNWLAHNNLGTALAEQGKVDEGAEHFRAALQIKPAYDDALSNLGRFLAERGKRDEAKVQFEALLRRNPRHARAHRNLGNVLFAEGNAAEGLSHYALARQLQPDDATTSEDLAAVLTKPAESQAVLPYLRQALDLLPTGKMRAQVASTWVGQGKFESAVQGYRAALVLQPQSPEILNNLAWILATCPEADVRDGAEAVRHGELACELTRFKRTLMVGTLAAAYAEAGRFAEAVVTAQKACALAAESGDETLAVKNQVLLQVYRAGRPHREATNAAPAEPVSPKP